MQQDKISMIAKEKSDRDCIVLFSSVCNCYKDLENALWQIAVVLFSNLCLVGRPVKDGRVVVHVLDVDHHRRVVFVQVVGSHQSQFVLCDLIFKVLIFKIPID